MSIIDFGRNTQQCELAFKFDCLSTSTIMKLVEHFLIKRKLFSVVFKEEAGNQVVLTAGDGSEKNPFFQLKLSRHGILLWAGYYVAYGNWQQRRDKALSETLVLLENLPLEFVQSITSQFTIAIPNDKIKAPHEVPELKPIRSFYLRFLPEELLARGNAYFVCGDAAGKQTITWWAGTSTTPAENTINYNIQLNVLDTSVTLADNISAHNKTTDELLDKYHSGFLALILKP